MKTILREFYTEPGPDPKNRQKSPAAESEAAKIVNDDPQGNPGEDQLWEHGAETASEEDRDEKTNNLRDALNSDSLPLPPDEREDDLAN